MFRRPAAACGAFYFLRSASGWPLIDPKHSARAQALADQFLPFLERYSLFSFDLMALTEVDFVARADGWFEIRSLSPSACLSRFPLHRGFRFDDWLQAALATDQLRNPLSPASGTKSSTKTAKKSTTYWLHGSASDLIQTVAKVLEYFDAPGIPSEELGRLRTRITQWVPDAALVSDYDLAFSDLELRELLADEVRNCQDVWNHQTLAIDPRSALDTVLQQLARRIADRDDPLARNKTNSGLLAASLRTPRSRTRNREVS